MRIQVRPKECVARIRRTIRQTAGLTNPEVPVIRDDVESRHSISLDKYGVWLESEKGTLRFGTLRLEATNLRHAKA